MQTTWSAMENKTGKVLTYDMTWHKICHTTNVNLDALI